MIFSVADLISILSKSFTYEPGDIISTGTPSGVGFIRKPPVYLQNGDVMVTEIQQIGKLINKVKTI
jgi:2-keto-4-pentenoate hydratase/2-oxohepta-3-ene-1,7-dioic acid hydratase in catechol pathway